jgi:hypothetical protein
LTRSFPDISSGNVVDQIGNYVDVGVVRPPVGPPYLRTHADGVWTNNLLALPRR